MKMPTYRAEHILKILAHADKGEQAVSARCRDLGIAEATFYRWRKTYRGMNLQMGTRPSRRASRRRARRGRSSPACNARLRGGAARFAMRCVSIPGRRGRTTTSSFVVLQSFHFGHCRNPAYPLSPSACHRDHAGGDSARWPWLPDRRSRFPINRY